VESYETVHLRKDGTEIRVSTSVSPVNDSEGNTVGAAAITRALAGSKRPEETFQRVPA